MIDVGEELMSKKMSDITVSEFCSIFEACLSYCITNEYFMPEEMPSAVSIKEVIHNTDFDGYVAKRTTIFWLAKYAVKFQGYLEQSAAALGNGTGGMLKTRIDLANVSRSKLNALRCKQCIKDKISEIIHSQGYELLD